MRNIPVNLGGFKLRVVEAPQIKTNDEGVVAMVYGTNDPQYVIGVFAKPTQVDEKGRRGRGEELRVTLMSDPGQVEEGDMVELIAPTVSHWEKDGRSGLSWKAQGLKPL